MASRPIAQRFRGLGGRLGVRSGATVNEPYVIRAERTFVLVRWLAVFVVLAGAPFAGMSTADLVATYVVALIGALYTLSVQNVLIGRHQEWLSGGYVTSVADAALISLAVFASGSATSPFFLAYFLGVVSVAVRFGVRASLVSAGSSILLYVVVLEIRSAGVPLAFGDLMLRAGFLVLTGLLAGYLSQEAQASRAALAAELARTRGLHRASAALAEENARLSASLKAQLQELEQTQHQLIQSAKLAAVGELAANVAHEINNPLTAVLTNVELVTEDLHPEAADQKSLQTIRDETLRARGIVRHLLDFARQTPPALELTDPRAILEATIPLIEQRAKVGGVELIRSYADEPLPIRVDPNQMKQVFINLLTNAIDAMPDGGRVYVTAQRRDDCITVAIRDTGIGVAPEHRDRIFEPFFSTKSAVSGTGLGLSVSYGIVERHRGKITVESTPGAGSTFVVTLPRAEHQAEALPEA